MLPPIVTVFCAFTRPEMVSRFIENLQAQTYHRGLMHLVFVVDGEYPGIVQKLQDAFEGQGYRSVRVKANGDHEVSESKLKERRARIAYVKNQSKIYIGMTDCQFVIGFEDDTVFPSGQTIDRLLAPFVAYADLGFVEGVQCGRWGAKMIGAWAVEFEDSKPIKASTLKREDKQEIITAGGFYGYATTKELYMAHRYYSDPSEPWGPDVNFGIWLALTGINSMILWDLEFGHALYDRVLWPDEDVGRVVFTLDKTTGYWQRRDYEDYRDNVGGISQGVK